MNKIMKEIRNYMKSEGFMPSDYIREGDSFHNAIAICPDCQEVEISTITQGTIPVCNCGIEKIVIFSFQGHEHNENFDEWFWEKIVYTVNEFENFVEQHKA